MMKAIIEKALNALRRGEESAALRALREIVEEERAKKKGRLLWVGDAAVATGFARVTHGVLETLRSQWDCHVLGINYTGDPHPYPYPIYPARTIKGGDFFGVSRTAHLVTQLKPDLVVCLNDPWNVPAYMKKAGNCPVFASMAVDGLNCRGRELNGLIGAVFWTEFGLREARRGGYQGLAEVIPLGVDLELYKPTHQAEARRLLGLPPRLVESGFVVGNVNRNQPRKRLDLTIAYFAEWIRSREVKDAYLYLHVAPTGDQGYDVNQLAQYYGVASRLIIAEPDIGQGVSEELVAKTYSAFDIQISTSQGEGFGLTTLEGMACGIPQIVPDWAALGEICGGAALTVPCTSTACTPNMINAIGGIADREEFIECLDRLYNSPAARDDLSARGLQLAGESCYRWHEIGAAFGRAIDEALNPARLRGAGNGQDEASRKRGNAAPATQALD
jgi:glycosyltransferase involved in cell wall biosynthesis